MRSALLFLLLSPFLLSNGGPQGDDAQVLQKCIDLPQLQAYYPLDADGNPRQLNVMQHGVSFPENIDVSANGKSLAFLSKKQVSQTEANAYFLFQEFKISGNSATVAFVYQYNQTELVVVSLVLNKNVDTWSVTNSNIEKRR